MEPITVIAGLATTVINRLWPDKTQAQKDLFRLELEKILAESALLKGQLEINAAEASNPNRKWITWRELVGYICAFALMWIYIIQPVVLFGFAAYGAPISKADLPDFDFLALMGLLTNLLGIGALKTFEKAKGLQDK